MDDDLEDVIGQELELRAKFGGIQASTYQMVTDWLSFYLFFNENDEEQVVISLQFQ